MKERNEQIDVVTRGDGPHIRSALDLWRLKGGRSHPVDERGRTPAPDSMLAVYGNRVTYTFILDGEVASIHFDRVRGEIFFKGHNIRHLTLNDAQMRSLMHMKEVLKNDDKAKELFPHYCATLDRFIADNNNGPRVHNSPREK